MKFWILILTFVSLFVSSCGGTDTGNPATGAQNTRSDGSCTEEVFVCPDASTVSRDPANACEFRACP